MERRVTASQVTTAMKRRGVTQFDLAVAAGIPQPTVSALLRGQARTSPERMARLGAAIVELGLDTVPEDPREAVFELPVPVGE